MNLRLPISLPAACLVLACNSCFGLTLWKTQDSNKTVAGRRTLPSDDLVARAEQTELRQSSGKVIPRVERDEHGQVTRLNLREMKLSPREMASLGSLAHLRALVLFRTNVTDADLGHLKPCEDLVHLNLTGTEVTDDAIDGILELRSLKSLCLGDVRITAGAIEKLKQRNRERGAPYLRWGYAPRKESP